MCILNACNDENRSGNERIIIPCLVEIWGRALVSERIRSMGYRAL